MVEVELETQLLQMELGTGAAVSLCPSRHIGPCFQKSLSKKKNTLKAYSGDPLRVVGQRDVRVIIAGQIVKLPLTVDAAWSQSITDYLVTVQFSKSCHVKQCKLYHVLDQYQTLLQPGLRTLDSYEAKIVVDPEARPHFCEVHFVPYTT